MKRDAHLSQTFSLEGTRLCDNDSLVKKLQTKINIQAHKGKMEVVSEYSESSETILVNVSIEVALNGHSVIPKKATDLLDWIAAQIMTYKTEDVDIEDTTILPPTYTACKPLDKKRRKSSLRRTARI